MDDGLSHLLSSNEGHGQRAHGKTGASRLALETGPAGLNFLRTSPPGNPRFACPGVYTF